MDTTDTAAKRPRIDNDVLDEIRAMHPGEPFERAVNKTIREVYDTRRMLAETILDLEGRRGVDDFLDQTGEMADQFRGVELVRLLKMGLRNKGIDL